MRHSPFHIGPLERDRWLTHMAAAVETVCEDASIAAELMQRATPLDITVVTWSGPESGYERAMAPFASLGEPMRSDVGAIDYVALQRSGDMSDPRAVGMYVKGGFITELSPRLIEALMGRFVSHPTRTTQLMFQLSGGAISRVAPDATAFARRNALANMLCLVGWRHGDDPSEHIAWIREFWPTVEPFTDGFYVNDLELETEQAEILSTYGVNAVRLAKVKSRYDPQNLFRVNQNIEPAFA